MSRGWSRIRACGCGWRRWWLGKLRPTCLELLRSGYCQHHWRKARSRRREVRRDISPRYIADTYRRDVSPRCIAEIYRQCVSPRYGRQRAVMIMCFLVNHEPRAEPCHAQITLRSPSSPSPSLSLSPPRPRSLSLPHPYALARGRQRVSAEPSH